MEVFLRGGQGFFVPSAVADNLLRLASHDQLKVLLFVLCHADETLSSEQIGEACGIKAEQVEEALVFWQNTQILPKQQEPLKVSKAPETAPQKPGAELPHSSTRLALSPSEIAQRVENDPETAQMVRGLERCLGRTPTQTELKSFIWMHEYLGLSVDVLLMLASFCENEGLFHPRYFEKIAIDWADREINSHTAVQRDLQRRKESRTFTGEIMKMFEMDRRPTDSQQEMVDSWQGIPMEIIDFAYQDSLEHTGGKLSIAYIHKILTRLREKGITTLEAAKADAQQFHKEHGRGAGGGKKPPRVKKRENASFTTEDLEAILQNA